MKKMTMILFGLMFVIIPLGGCVIDNTGGLLPPADDDDAAGDDDDSAAAGDDDDSDADDDDSTDEDEDEVCASSELAFWTNWYRDANGNGCLDWFEWDDHTDQYVGVATCTDGTFSTLWVEGDVEPGLPGVPFFDPTNPDSHCPDGDDDVADDDDASGDDDVADDDDAAGDDDDAGDDDTADDDDAGDPPATGDVECPGGWMIQVTRWWSDIDNDGCLDNTEADNASADPWIDVLSCSVGSSVDYSWWEFQTEVWVYSLPEEPFLPGTAAYACP